MKYSTEHNAWTNVTDEAVGSAMLHEYDKWHSHEEPLLGVLMSKKLQGANVLNIGQGIGIIDEILQQQLGANVQVYDTSPVMRARAAERIGAANVHETISTIKEASADAVLLCLVACIEPDDAKVRRIFETVRMAAAKDAWIFVTVCNPLIYNMPETAIDIRFPTGAPYEKIHMYDKMKKEGIPKSKHYGLRAERNFGRDKEPYMVREVHRSLKTYDDMLDEAGLAKVQTFFTPFWLSPTPDYAFLQRAPA